VAETDWRLEGEWMKNCYVLFSAIVGGIARVSLVIFVEMRTESLVS